MVNLSFSVPLKPPWLLALAEKVISNCSFSQPFVLISCGMYQFPGVKVILGLMIWRFLELEMLTLTSTVPVGCFVSTTPTVCCSSVSVELFDL